MTPPAAGATRSLDLKTPSNPRRLTARNARRVSGPARPNARASSGVSRSVAAVALPAPGIALPARRPRRTTTPSPRRVKPGSTRNPGIALRTAGAFERVSASALLDRLIHGRLWIGLLAFALIGIVAMQLVVLKLNTGIGDKLQREASLQRENAELGIENSEYSAESRIAPLAAATGMTFAPAGTVHYVTANPDDLSRATSALSSSLQSSTSTQSESGEAVAGETSATTQSAAATGEAETSESASATGSAESTSGSSETSPAPSAESNASAPAATATAPASATEPESSAGAQDSGASATPAGGASAPAADAQAAPRG
jgi:hypothetical protein